MEDTGEAILFTEKQEAALKEKKINLKITHEKYLRKHPELAVLIQEAISRALLEHPLDPVAFVEDFFIKSDLQQVLDETAERKRQLYKR